MHRARAGLMDDQHSGGGPFLWLRRIGVSNNGLVIVRKWMTWQAAAGAVCLLAIAVGVVLEIRRALADEAPAPVTELTLNPIEGSHTSVSVWEHYTPPSSIWM